MKEVKVSFLKGRENGSRCVTWGTPWSKSELKSLPNMSLRDSGGNEFEAQGKPTAFWEDGSVKWSLHSANLENAVSDSLTLAETAKEAGKPLAEETDEFINVETAIKAVFYKHDPERFLKDIKKNEAVVCNGAKLVCIIEERNANTRTENKYSGKIQNICLEENGPLRCVVKLSGIHTCEGIDSELFPFAVRLYFYKGSDEIKITHTFLYDGDASVHFIKGVGMSFDIPLENKPYNRHVKFAGDSGFMHEPLQLLTSWRPKLDPEFYKKQFSGEMAHFNFEPEEGSVDESNLKALSDITMWDNFKMFQDSSEHYVIRKRTQSDECAYIDAVHGGRARGLAYVGSFKNGLAVGMRDFWQKYPSALYINNASGEITTVTAWLWAPDAEAADLRHYDTKAHAGSYYEGFDEIRSTPYGIGNTNELYIKGFDKLALDSQLKKMVNTVNNPPALVCEPEYYHSAGAFGVWGLANKSGEKREWLEEQLNKCVSYYINEIEQRKWYGFFNYGDFMHTYDDTRHSWRYDMGGYAWQNTELVPTLWLWLQFMRTGRTDVYNMAEAMTRHTSEVDIYHFGEYKGLGSRHNVIHWGCACKEARIAMAGHHRYFYYLTGDERTGDIIDDVRDAEYGVERLDPLRFFYNDGLKTHARTGPDWSALCSNWMAAWERHKDSAAWGKLLKGIEGIKAAPMKLVSGSDFGFDPDTGEMIYIGESAAGGSHLVICMGAPSVWFEMSGMINDPEWDKMMADYGEFYMLPGEEKEKKSNGLVAGSGWSFPYMASSMMAYSAKYKNDPKMAAEVWKILIDEWKNFNFEPVPVSGYSTSGVRTEVRGISTNFIAQWCLNVIICLELIEEWL